MGMNDRARGRQSSDGDVSTEGGGGLPEIPDEESGVNPGPSVHDQTETERGSGETCDDEGGDDDNDDKVFKGFGARTVGKIGVPVVTNEHTGETEAVARRQVEKARDE